MYQELYQSSIRPFRATPDSNFYFAHNSIESARQTVVRAVLRAEGPVMVLGGAGLGKSLLAELIAKDVAERLDVVCLHSARLCSRQALLQNILFELNLPYRNLTEGELRLSILDRLEPSSGRAPDGVLLIIDEAHTLPAKLLDELRLISNFTRNNQPRSRLVLIGNMRLEDTFTGPLMDSFNQRLAARCYLQPMNRRDTVEFVRHQLSVAGVSANEIITNEGLEALYAASEGVPRLANQIMDHALMLAINNNQRPISSSLVEEAWSELQQLPTPWHQGTDSRSRAENTQTHSIEFGTLEDLPTIEQIADDSMELESNELVNSIPDSSATNFFSAFCLPTEDSEFEETFDESVEGTADEEVEQDIAPDSPMVVVLNESTDEIITPSEELFDASIAFTLSPPQSVAEDFFAGRPTDVELLALEDEQTQYDSMGVWENDPPLEVADELVEPTTPPLLRLEELDVDDVDQVETRDNPQLPSFSENIFGDDFDEEVSVPVTADQVRLRQSVENRAKREPVAQVNIPSSVNLEPEVLGVGGFAEPLPELELDSSESSSGNELNGQDLDGQELVAKNNATDTITAARPESEQQLESEVADYVARIQAYADAIIASQAESSTVEQVVAELETNQLEALNQSWQVDTTAIDDQNTLQIASDIEDLVSQLNFSAFSVEPYSVEQISLDAPVSKGIPNDSIRSGDNAEIYMLHRPQDSERRSIFSGDAVDYDDDRDLLIIEEDLPVSSKLTDQVPAEKQTIKTSPYNQLFAKLRK